MLLQNESKFDLDKFIKPDVLYAPVYIWVWNDLCTKEKIDEQLAEMQRLGIRAFYILPEPKDFRPNSMPTKLSPDYMTDEYLELCSYAMKCGKEKGMNCWIYDEGGWPSGGACGKVLKNHPEYAKSAISTNTVSFAEGSEYVPSAENVLAAFDENEKQISSGYVFNRNTVVTEYCMKLFNYGGADYPDLLNRKATDHFIEITHDKYASALGELCGNGVYAVFTDEPKAPHNPINNELIEKYSKENGESILPYLPLLAGRIPANNKEAEVLRRWNDLCSRTYCENFLLPCRNWSSEHGMMFTGHLDKDHEALGCVRGGGHFQIMRALRCFDLPGIDVIWRQLYPVEWSDCRNEENGVNGFFPRYASSAARQNGTEFAMSESFGVLGAGAPYEVMRYQIGYQAVRGINIFNFFDYSMGREGAFLAQELPVYSEKQIYCRDLFRFNEYTERLSYLSSLGNRKCDTALYYPVNDFWSRVNAEAVAEEFELLGRALENRFIDFDVIDDDIIVGALKRSDGCLSVGRAVYKNIVIPPNAYIPPKTAESLKQFELMGGRVVSSAEDLPAWGEIRGNTEGLRAVRREIDGGELVLFFREGGSSDKFNLSVSSENVFALNLETGKMRKLPVKNGVAEAALVLGETLGLLVGNFNLQAEAELEITKTVGLDNTFEFTKKLEQSCSDSGFEEIPHEEMFVECRLGSWNAFVSEEFSGCGVYKTEFELSGAQVGKAGRLDLGRVAYTARVELNGVDLGVAIMPPHRFDIPEGLLHKKNVLKIFVTNTDANWYVHTDFFDKWEKKQLSPYFEGEINYAKDYADGGLYGPVMLCF